MSYFRFEDKKIQREFFKIASKDNKMRKIDSEYERKLLNDLLSQNKKNLSKHDIALLEAQTLNFEDKGLKKEYRKISNQNGKNRKIDTEKEKELFKKLIKELDSEKISENDKRVLEKMGYYDLDKTINVDLNIEEGAQVENLIIGKFGDEEYTRYNLSVNGEKIVENKVLDGINLDVNLEELNNKLPPIGSGDKIPTDLVGAELGKGLDSKFSAENALPAEKKSPTPVKDDESKVVKYEVKKGDYWYKVVAEKYNISNHQDISKIVRKLKDAYFDKNKAELTKQGHANSKSGFMPKIGQHLELPAEIEIDGVKYTCS